MQPIFWVICFFVWLGSGAISLAGVIGEDDREEITKTKVKLGLSDREVEQAMRCTGHIYCPTAAKYGLGMGSAGAVCPSYVSPDRPCRADRVATSLHLFVEKYPERFIAGLNRCEFMNYRGFKSRLNVDDIKLRAPTDDRSSPHKNMRADKIVIRLTSAIPGCDPYQLVSEADQAVAGQPLIALTHIQEDHAGRLDGTKPLAYPCVAKRAFPGRNGQPMVFYSDCDMNGVGSGGFTVVRGHDSMLRVNGIFVRSSFSETNGQKYNEAEKIFTVSVGTDGDFYSLPAEAVAPALKKKK